MIANIVIPPAARPGIAAPDGLDLVAHPHRRVTKQELYHRPGVKHTGTHPAVRNSGDGRQGVRQFTAGFRRA
ncbi:hypothetical protein GCM10017784_25720 [Deinococcus indicus]|nr:hypothetical protein GCM10017784_25720 [Deinococcus indicus]